MGDIGTVGVVGLYAVLTHCKTDFNSPSHKGAHSVEHALPLDPLSLVPWPLSLAPCPLSLVPCPASVVPCPSTHLSRDVCVCVFANKLESTQLMRENRTWRKVVGFTREGILQGLHYITSHEDRYTAQQRWQTWLKGCSLHYFMQQNEKLTDLVRKSVGMNERRIVYFLLKFVKEVSDVFLGLRNGLKFQENSDRWNLTGIHSKRLF
jgi:hypothetical protein